MDHLSHENIIIILFIEISLEIFKTSPFYIQNFKFPILLSIEHNKIFNNTLLILDFTWILDTPPILLKCWDFVLIHSVPLTLRSSEVPFLTNICEMNIIIHIFSYHFYTQSNFFSPYSVFSVFPIIFKKKNHPMSFWWTSKFLF